MRMAVAAAFAPDHDLAQEDPGRAVATLRDRHGRASGAAVPA
ncbi:MULTISPECIES: hypothetical protein [unclassified Kitasatospora]